MKDKMDLPDNSELVADQNGSANQKTPGVDASRRRLFGAGVAAPVILSMSSRTAWGGALCGPSAFNSMTFSSHAPQAYVDDCTNPAGKGPVYWRDHPESWPTMYYLPEDPTDPTVIGSVAPFSTRSMSAVLSDVMSNETGSIEAHGVAALLNASSSLNLFGQTSPSLAKSLVETLFVGFVNGGSATLPNSSTVVYWSSGSYPMQSYFTNYA